jgi:hypothetical protein
MGRAPTNAGPTPARTKEREPHARDQGGFPHGPRHRIRAGRTGRS